MFLPEILKKAALHNFCKTFDDVIIIPFLVIRRNIVKSNWKENKHEKVNILRTIKYFLSNKKYRSLRFSD